MQLLDVNQYKETMLVSCRCDISAALPMKLRNEFSLLADRLSQSECRNLVIDLRAVKSIPFTVLDAMRALNSRCLSAGGKFRVCCVDETAEHVRKAGLQVFSDFKSALTPIHQSAYEMAAVDVDSLSTADGHDADASSD